MSVHPCQDFSLRRKLPVKLEKMRRTTPRARLWQNRAPFFRHLSARVVAREDFDANPTDTTPAPDWQLTRAAFAAATIPNAAAAGVKSLAKSGSKELRQAGLTQSQPRNLSSRFHGQRIQHHPARSAARRNEISPHRHAAAASRFGADAREAAHLRADLDARPAA